MDPGLSHNFRITSLEASSQPERHKKIEGRHTSDECCYVPTSSNRDFYYLVRNCKCGKFNNGEKEVHYSPQCHYAAKRDTGTTAVYLLLKCQCHTTILLSRTPNTGCVLM